MTMSSRRDDVVNVMSQVILTTEPLWATLFAVALLGEALAPTDWAGGALILSACAVSEGQSHVVFR